MEIPNDFCICCLEQSGLVNLNSCKHRNFLMDQIKLKMEQKQFVCLMCHMLLKKFEEFKQRVNETQLMLQKAYVDGNTISLHRSLNFAEIQIWSTTDCETTTGDRKNSSDAFAYRTALNYTVFKEEQVIVKVEEIDVKDEDDAPLSETKRSMERSVRSERVKATRGHSANSERRKYNQKMTSRVKASAAQLSYLVDFMRANQEFASGRYCGLRGKVALEQQWLQLSDTLNTLGGPIKSMFKWKQTWRDVRNADKRKALRNKKELNQECPGGAAIGGSRLSSLIPPEAALIPRAMTYEVPCTSVACPRAPSPVPSKLSSLSVEMRDDAAAPLCDSLTTTAKVAQACNARVQSGQRDTSVPLLRSVAAAEAPSRSRLRRRRRYLSPTETSDIQIMKLERNRLKLQQLQLSLEEKKLDLQQRQLVIDEAKLKVLERIATASEQNIDLKMDEIRNLK